MTYNDFLTNMNIPNIKRNPLEYVFECNMVDQGIWCEFGVFSGKTINYISKFTTNIVYGFDTFEGLPEEWEVSSNKKIKKGFYSFRDCAQNQEKFPTVNSNVELIEGLFSDTLPSFVKDKDSINFLHIDCDLYSSTKDIFNNISHLIKENCIIVFDELVNYPNYREHEIKAFYEWVTENNIQLEFIGMNGIIEDSVVDNKYNQKVAVKITKARK